MAVEGVAKGDAERVGETEGEVSEEEGSEEEESSGNAMAMDGG